MNRVYSLYPGEQLRAARAEFRAYEIVELHDHTDRTEYTAVLKPAYLASGRPVLVRSATLTGLAAELRRHAPRPAAAHCGAARPAPAQTAAPRPVPAQGAAPGLVPAQGGTSRPVPAQGGPSDAS